MVTFEPLYPIFTVVPNLHTVKVNYAFVLHSEDGMNVYIRLCVMKCSLLYFDLT